LSTEITKEYDPSRWNNRLLNVNDRINPKSVVVGDSP
jgi:hypothetical protein